MQRNLVPDCQIAGRQIEAPKTFSAWARIRKASPLRHCCQRSPGVRSPPVLRTDRSNPCVTELQMPSTAACGTRLICGIVFRLARESIKHGYGDDIRGCRLCPDLPRRGFGKELD